MKLSCMHIPFWMIRLRARARKCERIEAHVSSLLGDSIRNFFQPNPQNERTTFSLRQQNKIGDIKILVLRDTETLSIQVGSKAEQRLVELKAKVTDLDAVRRRLSRVDARRIGSFRQIDTYFDVPEGRLKLREVERSNMAKLVYYERRNVAGPKRSDVFILEIQEPRAIKNLLQKILKTKVVVDKTREMFRCQGATFGSRQRYVQIHLDDVKRLGAFVEFEMLSSEGTENGDRQILKNLMNILGIKTSQLQRFSYSDLMPRAHT